MPVVSMISRKGGVGKTTLTLALADFLCSIHGRDVLVIDMDPQASASIALLGEDDWKALDETQRTVADLFDHAVRRSDPQEPFDIDLLIETPARVKGASGEVHVMASSPRLQSIEDSATETLARWSPYGGSPYMLLQQPFMKRVLNEYDYVLIDCPPSMGMITLNALTISSGYLITTTPDYVSTAGLDHVTERVKQHATGLRRRIPLYGTVVSLFRQSSLRHAVILEELHARPEVQPIWDTVIPETTRAREVLGQSEELMSLSARYGGGAGSTYASFSALADEFLQRVS
jgi:chromosome partitioning protein